MSQPVLHAAPFAAIPSSETTAARPSMTETVLRITYLQTPSPNPRLPILKHLRCSFLRVLKEGPCGVVVLVLVSGELRVLKIVCHPHSSRLLVLTLQQLADVPLKLVCSKKPG
jgi:hypothetical protein